MNFLGFSTSQLSAVAYAQGAFLVEGTEQEFKAWISQHEYVWLKSNGVVGIRVLREQEISERARRCCENYVNELNFRLGV
jgi:hypothetical protein